MRYTNHLQCAISTLRNDESALRLLGALQAEYNKVWQERKYFDMDESTEWVAQAVRATPLFTLAS